MFLDLFGAMTDDDDDVLNLSRAQIANAAFDNRRFTEREQRFEDAHAARTTGGEENCCDIIHAKKITTKTRRHKEFKLEVMKRLFLVT